MDTGIDEYMDGWMDIQTDIQKIDRQIIVR
jgi:hypothetical protein